MKNACLAVMLVLCGVAALPAGANDAAILGTQRAALSRLEWETRDAGHPSLGNIRYSYNKVLVETPIGSSKVYSRAYVSCGRTSGKIAIEVTNTKAPDDPGGLQPAKMPRLLCSRPPPPREALMPQEEIPTTWTVHEKTGDALTHGLSPSKLRECAFIAIVQEVTLPVGWAQKVARVELELHPYGRDLDAIFATCGERPVHAHAPVPTAAPAQAAPAATPSAPVAAAPKAAPDPEGWQRVRTVSSGRTNVRAGPNIQSKSVVQLDAGSVILAQRAENDWWRVKPTRGAKGFEGYVREDRLVFP